MLNFQNVDIVDCLTKIVNETTAKHRADFKFDMLRVFNEAQKARDSGEPRHLLWMARRNGTWCVSEGNAYIKDTPENKIWCGYRYEPDGVKAFAVEVLGVRDNAAVGNVYELVYTEHVDWMSSHLFTARSVLVELCDGESINIDMNEFNYYKLQLERDAVTNISYVLDDDSQKYHEFLAEIKRTRTIYCGRKEDAPE